jgi:hypothetical protein
MPKRDSRAWCLGIIKQWKQLEWRSPILNSLLDCKPYRNNKMAADILRLAPAENLGIDDLRLTAYLLEPVLDALGREKQGRKRTLTTENMQLLSDVDALLARSRMSARSVCAHHLMARSTPVDHTEGSAGAPCSSATSMRSGAVRPIIARVVALRRGDTFLHPQRLAALHSQKRGRAYSRNVRC